MSRVPFATMPGHSRLWVFAAERALAPPEQDRLMQTVDAFLDAWAAHGQPLTCARDLRYGRFLLVAVDEEAAGASGCSVDALVRQIRGLESGLGVVLVDHGPVLYREGTEIRRVSREEFADLARAGRVTPATVVFDNTIGRVEALERGWEVSAGDAWHGRAFFAQGIN
jgi:hypothetical protein